MAKKRAKSETGEEDYVMAKKKHAKSETREEDSVMKINTIQKDYISALPDDILSSIISLLRMNETVCASLVSVKWRHLCASRSHLKFEWSDVFKTPANSECYQGLKDEYVRRVDQFLKFYTGSKIVCFGISFGLRREYAPYLDRWISFAVSRGVEKLGLNFLCAEIKRPNVIKNHHELYVFPCQLLSQGEPSKLTSLFLRSCIIGIDSSNQLSSLKILMLFFVPLESRDLQNIFSCCSNLATLQFRTCRLPIKLLVCGALPHLKCLKVLYCSGVKEIELLAPNLIFFEYAGGEVELSFAEVPNLEKVYIRVTGRCVHYVFSKLARDLPQLKTLSVHANSNLVQWLPKRITTFSKVKQLQLYFSGDMEFDISRVTAILSACPILKMFHLVMDSPSNEQRQSHKVLEECDQCRHDQLKEVEIGGFTGTLNVMSFAIYLLKNATSLELMVIDPQAELYHGGDYWTCGKRMWWDIGERELVRKQLQENVSNNSVLIIR